VLAGGTLVTSAVLQKFSRARFIQLSLRAFFTDETATDSFGIPVPTFPFYQVADLQVSANGVIVSDGGPVLVAGYCCQQIFSCFQAVSLGLTLARSSGGAHAMATPTLVPPARMAC
jgi:hypothetical protein